MSPKLELESGTRDAARVGDFAGMKKIIRLVAVLILATLAGGCASRVGVSSRHHQFGAAAAVR